MSSAPNIAIEFDKEHYGNIFLGYKPGNTYVNEFLFPNIQVSSPTGAFDSEGTRSSEHLRVNLPTEVKGSARIERIQYSQTYTTGWATIAHAVGMDVDSATCWQMAPHEIQVLSQNGTTYSEARYAAGKNKALTKFSKLLKLNRLTVAEYAGATLACTAGSYASTNKITLSGTDQWSNPNSDVIGAVETAKKAVHIYSGTPANRMVISLNTAYALRQHPQLTAIKKIALNGGKVVNMMLTTEELEQIFQLEIRIADAQYETANHGATSSKSQIWGNFCWVGYVNPTPSEDVVEYSFGYNFWRPIMGGTGRVSMRLTDPDQHSIGGNTQTLYAEEEYDQLLLSAKAGYLFTNPIA